jgi:hypothetical protein
VLSFIFRSSAEPDVDCWVRWEQEGVCLDQPWHDLSRDTSEITWSTHDCARISEAGKGDFTAVEGWVRMKSSALHPGDSVAEGAEIGLEIEADIEARSADGVQLAGTIKVDTDVTIQLTAPMVCAGHNGDADGDSFTGELYGGTDCDDYDPTIGPQAHEVCDEVDNNCDGAIDEGVQTPFYRDTDGDGYGVVEDTVWACELPDGYAEFDDDCDPDDASVNPRADELCDGIDNDCDGTADEGATVAAYPDEDGDTYGDDALRDLFCPADVPSDWIEQGGDCDDTDPDIKPWAEEICDGVDNDCNGGIDEIDECVEEG